MKKEKRFPISCNFKMGKEQGQRLEDLKEKTTQSKGAIIRQSLEVYFQYLEDLEQGQ